MDLFFRSFWHYIPSSIAYYLRYLPGRGYARFRHFHDFMRSFAESVVANSQVKGDGEDIISVLLQANSEEATRGHLSENEVMAQISYVHQNSLEIPLISDYSKDDIISRS